MHAPFTYRGFHRSIGMLLIMLSISACRPAPQLAPTTVPAEPLAPFGITAADQPLAPDFTLPTLDGGEFTLSQHQGEWVLINFWATWCAPCREEMPYLNELAAAATPPLTVVGVNLRERPAEVEAFVDEVAVTFPIALQPDDATLLAYDVRGLPVSILVAPDGTLVRRIVGLVTAESLTGRK